MKKVYDSKEQKKVKFEKAIVLILTLVLLVLMVYFLMAEFIPDMADILHSEDKTVALEEFLQSRSRFVGIFCLAMFQVFQVVSIFIPGAFIQIAGGFVYGTLTSFIVCHLAFTFTNTIVFYLAKRGMSPIGKLISKDNRFVKKITSWLDSSNPAFMMLLAYMMPGVPNGFIPYAAMHTKITVKGFALAAYTGSLLQILIMCLVGSKLKAGDYLVSAILVIVSIALIIVLYKNRVRIINFFQRCISKKHKDR